MGLTFIPIDKHGDFPDLDLDQHEHYFLQSGEEAFGGDFKVGHYDILDCNDMDIEGDLTVLGVIDGFTAGGDIDMNNFDIIGCSVLKVDSIEGKESPVYFKETPIRVSLGQSIQFEYELDSEFSTLFAMEEGPVMTIFGGEIPMFVETNNLQWLVVKSLHGEEPGPIGYFEFRSDDRDNGENLLLHMDSQGVVIGQDTSIEGDLVVDDDLTVWYDLTVQNDVTVENNVNIGNDLNVEGIVLPRDRGVSSQDLCLYLSLNGHLRDLGGLGMDASVVGSEDYVGGKFGNAYEFDGATDAIVFGASDEAFPDDDNWTQMFWFKSAHGSTIDDDAWMLITRRPGGGSATKIQFEEINDSLTFVYRNSGGWGTDIVGPSLAELGSGWHHVAVTYDGTTFIMYVDSVAVGSVVDTDFTGFGPEPMVFGYNDTGPAMAWFDGVAEEIITYCKTLEPIEIKVHFERNKEMISNLAYLRLIGEQTVDGGLIVDGDLFTGDIYCDDIDGFNADLGGYLNVEGLTTLGDGIDDYTEFGIDGFQMMYGTARVTNHVSVFATGAGPGISTPTLTTRAIGASGGITVDVLRFSDILQNDSRLGFCGPPAIDNSVNGHFVLKWIPGATYNNAGFYRWVMEYIVKDSDEDITTGTPITVFVDVTPTNNTDRIETVFPGSVDLDGGQRVSAHFYRDTATDTANGGGGDVEEWQFEYTANKLGKQIAA